jgi:hypothetical protein
MVARNLRRWALFDKAAEQHLAPPSMPEKGRAKHGHSLDQRSVQDGLLYMEAMISRKIVRSIRLMHPFTYRGALLKASHKYTRDSSQPAMQYVPKSKTQCSSHLLVPLEALDRDRLESLVLRSELSLPRLELASSEG